MNQIYHGLRLEQWLCLSFIEGVGPNRLARLYAYQKTLHESQASENPPDEGDHEDRLQLDQDILKKLKWPPQTAREAIDFIRTGILSDDAEQKKQTTLLWLESDENRVLFRDSPDYPRLLREIAVPPTLLYVRGRSACWNELKTLGIVGARRASTFGRKLTRDWSQVLSAQDICIVSGGAMGVDTHAHQGALDRQKETVAVMGTGLLKPYPKQNLALFDSILEYGGALVSEYPLTTEVRPHLFPPRNRIISGMSSGILVVEASARSGSLISAKYALEQNRNVYAVPGQVGDKLAEGPNNLIRQGATLVTSADDIFEELHSPFISALVDDPASQSTVPIAKQHTKEPIDKQTGAMQQKDTFLKQKPESQMALPDFLSEEATRLFHLLERERVPLDFDALVRLCGWSAPDLMQTLMELELNGCIVNQQGAYFKCV